MINLKKIVTTLIIVTQCIKMKILLNKCPDIKNNLEWYSLSMNFVCSIKGILFLIKTFINKNIEDDIAGNYNLKRFYSKEVKINFLKSSQAVWNYKKIKNEPYYSKNSIISLLEKNAQIVQEEFQQIMKSIGTHPDNNSLAKNGTWKGEFFFDVNQNLNYELIDKMPKTYSMIKKLPLCFNFGFVMISGLEPKTKIKAHTGSCNFRLRTHLGLYIPEPEKAYIQVADKKLRWSNNRAFSFDDSFLHSVEHFGEKPRYILAIDTWHPSLNSKEVEIFSNKLFSEFGNC